MDRVVQLLIVSGTASCAFAQLAAPAPLVGQRAAGNGVARVVNAPVEADWAVPQESAFNVDVHSEDVDWADNDQEVSVQSLPASIKLVRPAALKPFRQASDAENTAAASVQSVAKLAAGASVQSVAKTAGGAPVQGLGSLVDAPYTGFDILEWARVWQSFRDHVLGFAGPDYASFLWSFNGADLLERFSTMQLGPLIASILKAFDLPNVGQLLRSVQGMRVSVLLPMALKIVKDTPLVRNSKPLFTSKPTLQEVIVGLDPKPLAQKLQAAGVPQFIEQYTGLDLSSYFAALATYDGQRLLASLQAVTGNDIVQLVKDLDAEDYLGEYLGLNTDPLYSKLRAFSLANFLAADLVPDDLLAAVEDAVADVLETFIAMATPLTSATVRAPNGAAILTQSARLDTLRVGNAADKLLDKILGTTSTDLVEVIRSLNLSAVGSKLRTLDVSAVVAAAESALNGMTPAQRQQLVTDVLSTATDVWTWLVGLTGADIIELIASSTGEGVVNCLAARNLHKYATMIAHYGLLGPIRQLTGIDLALLLQAVASIRVVDVVANLRLLTGEDMVQFLDDAGISEYLSNAGFDLTRLRAIAGQLLGSQVVDYVLHKSGREVLEEIRSMNGPALVSRINQDANTVLTAGGVVLKLITPSA